ncbi:cinnamoyl-CoA reductase CAD2-like isoform X1 [Vicia villosa]|uniref:cinnamoyl-CoA reductase CAD2-like isoform X1 n=1 Tax=Vicia villosa TaxID=3911 RepID=UPI00273A7F5A|nr:cinnamoyl-CoA reductase CAD2-like isoform X1 [Vicia villosa]XP_058752365.1 cinnamoyl-CoA reductase CAD2-like isoform X1 [Vicia villosa]
MSGEGKVVCVTGASGYIASWIVKFLLQRRYTVRATVRDLAGNPKKVDHLTKLDGAKERLHLFKADLLEEGSFDSAVEGCDGVFHTASPVRVVVKDPQVELIDPAVKGTLNVLKSCAKSPSVKRVVFTSSVAAIAYNTRPKNPEVIVDETWFSDPDFCRESQSWYVLSKALAEAAAWEFVNENKIDMVVINPTMVAGPLLQPEVNESVQSILNLINGIPFPNYAFGWVNVKDVANAHIHAYEIASASGRYCLAERVVHHSELANILQDLYPTLQISDKCENEETYMTTYQISKEKAKRLGIEFTPLEVSLKETVESFREKKIVDF